VRADGTQEWYRNGRRHRIDGPAIEHANGTNEWYRDGQLHREDGAAVEWPNGGKWWYRHGQRHREDGPAIEAADGTMHWYREGQKVYPDLTSQAVDSHARMMRRAGLAAGLEPRTSTERESDSTPGDLFPRT
jgi:hypothetical protein